MTEELQENWHTIDIYSPEGHFLCRMSREEYEEAAAFSEALNAFLARGLKELTARFPGNEVQTRADDVELTVTRPS